MGQRLSRSRRQSKGSQPGSQTAIVPKDGIIRELAMHSDAISAVTSWDDCCVSGDETGALKLWRKDTVAAEAKEHTRGITKIRYHVGTQTLASASRDSTIVLYNSSLKVLHKLQGHKLAVTAIAFAPDGQTLFSAARDGTAMLWSVDGHVLKEASVLRNVATDAAFVAPGRLIQTSEDKILRTWAAPNLDIVSEHPRQQQIQTCIAVSQSGQHLAIGTGANASSGAQVILMDASGSVIRAKRLHELAVTAVLFLDNDRIASCGRDGKFNVLNFHTLAVERELLLQAPALCMTSYSGHIVIGLANGKIVVVHT